MYVRHRARPYVCFNDVANFYVVYALKTFGRSDHRARDKTLVCHHGDEGPAVAQRLAQPDQVVVRHRVDVCGRVKRRLTLLRRAVEHGHAQVAQMLPLRDLVRPCGDGHALWREHQHREHVVQQVEVRQRGERRDGLAGPHQSPNTATRSIINKLHNVMLVVVRHEGSAHCAASRNASASVRITERSALSWAMRA